VAALVVVVQVWVARREQLLRGLANPATAAHPRTSASRRRTNRLNKADFPTFGRPTSATCRRRAASSVSLHTAEASLQALL
jgi:hypothetical protein